MEVKEMIIVTASASKKTVEEINKLTSNEDREIAAFFRLLAQTTQALGEQSSFIRKLQDKKRKEIIEISRSNPHLAPLLELMKMMEQQAVGIAWPETEEEMADSPVSEPAYFTIRDVAYLLDVSPQEVRILCENKN
jgi:type I site-specific restriction endonuclease